MSTAVVKPPNGYDLAFARWFEAHGWRVHVYVGEIAVWVTDDAPCPFTVTRGMIERLTGAGKLEQVFPANAGVFDDFYVTKQ